MRKSPLEMNLEERKSVLIQSCFLEMADMDYLSARWTYGNGIFHNFYWLAAQCIEKYLKGALLYNGHSVKKLGHDLNILFDKLCKIKPDLHDLVIAMPNSTGMGRSNWHEKPMSLFVDYINQYGSPDARYSLMGTFINGPVIHPLDRLCSATRCLIRHKNFFGEDLFLFSKKNDPSHLRRNVDVEWMIDSELLLEQLFVGQYQVGQSEALLDTLKKIY